jgi:hypothetical protein
MSMYRDDFLFVFFSRGGARVNKCPTGDLVTTQKVESSFTTATEKDNEASQPNAAYYLLFLWVLTLGSLV